jgi:hypothetical protein
MCSWNRITESPVGVIDAFSVIWTKASPNAAWANLLSVVAFYFDKEEQKFELEQLLFSV